MLKKIKLLLAFVYIAQYAQSQVIEDYFYNDQFLEVVKFEKDTQTLSGEQLVILGDAFFELKNYDKALLMYDKALAKGFKDAPLFYNRSRAYFFDEKTAEALKELNIALEMEPENQEFISQLGLTYYFDNQLDKALSTFQKAQQLPAKVQAPYYMVGHIFFLKEDRETALKEFYKGLNHLTPDNEFYLNCLTDIGLLEYIHTKNYSKSVAAYTKAIDVQPDNYELYINLIKALNAEGNYQKANQHFVLLQKAYDNNELPEDYMKYQSVPIDEFMWKDQMILVYQYLVKPENTLDPYFRGYLLTPDGENIERSFLTEKTMDIGLPNTPKHLFCEEGKNGSHYTYPLGWSSDDIPLKDFRKAIIDALDDKLKPSASSSFNKD